jgi:hypothetical protein
MNRGRIQADESSFVDLLGRANKSTKLDSSACILTWGTASQVYETLALKSYAEARGAHKHTAQATNIETIKPDALAATG